MNINKFDSDIISLVQNEYDKHSNSNFVHICHFIRFGSCQRLFYAYHSSCFAIYVARSSFE